MSGLCGDSGKADSMFPSRAASVRLPFFFAFGHGGATRLRLDRLLPASQNSFA